MGNIVASNNNIAASNLQTDGSFAGAVHTVTSTAVNFTGANQTISFTGAGKIINFGSLADATATINYYNVPTFHNSSNGAFKIGTAAFLDSNGKIASSFIPTISTLGTVSNVNTTTLKAAGAITGANFYTSVNGRFNGPVTGNVIGDVTGNVTGTTSSINIGGAITGANLYATSISSSTPKFTEGGGLKIGANKWTIAENASGNLCFYNNNGTAGTTTVPYACIQGGAPGTAGVGNLVAGTA